VEATEKRTTRSLLYVALVVGFLFTIAAVFLSLVNVSIIPRDEGPRATALVGGGDAEVGGVTLQLGEYTITAGGPQYAGTKNSIVQAACRSTDFPNSGGKSTESLLPVTVEPTGTLWCLTEGNQQEFDHGRLIVQVDQIGLIQAKPKESYSFLPLSKIDAQVQKPSVEIWEEVAVLILVAAGPALCVSVLIELLLRGRKSDQSLSSSSAVNRNHVPRDAADVTETESA
jgi:hypothetical protein